MSIAKPKWFGAIKDGITNDTSAIQLAIDSLASTGGIVQFESGIYSVGALSCPPNVSLIGKGIGSTILKKNTNCDLITLNDRNIIKDIQLDGNGTLFTGRTLYVADGFNHLISNVQIIASKGIGLEFANDKGGGTSVEHIRINVIDNYTVPCIYAPATGAAPLFFDSMWLSDGYFDFSNALGRSINLVNFYDSQFKFNANSQIISISNGRCRTANQGSIYKLTLSGGQVLLNNVDFGGSIDLSSAQEIKISSCSYTDIVEDINTCQYCFYDKLATQFSTVNFTSDNSTDVITYAGYDIPDLTKVRLANTGGALPTGLSTITDYWTIRQSSTTSKLASSFANAKAGTAINFTTNGTGTSSISPALWYQLSGTQPSLGNGSFTGYYTRIGTLCKFSGRLTMGSSTTYGNSSVAYRFDLPFAGTFARNQYISNGARITRVSNNTQYICEVIIGAAESTFTLAYNGLGIYLDTPFIYANGDFIDFDFEFITR